MDNNSAEAHVELDGVKYYTLLEQPPNGALDAPCVLLVHALMSNLLMWDATVRILNHAGYRTIRYDHIGHRHTLPPQDLKASYHMDDLTRHAHQIVKARTGQSHLKAIIGCSIGGVVALRYAMMFPTDVDKIVSIAAPGIVTPEASKILWTERIEQFEQDLKHGSDSLCAATITRWFPGARPEDNAVRAEALAHVKMCSIDGYKVLADTIRDYDYAGEVGGIDMECLVVAGAEDKAGDPGRLREVASMITGAQFVLMDRTGHLPPMHKVEEFGEVMMQFLGA